MRILEIATQYQNEALSWKVFNCALSNTPKDVLIHFRGLSDPFYTNIIDFIWAAHEAGYKTAVTTTTANMKLTDVHELVGVPFVFFNIVQLSIKLSRVVIKCTNCIHNARLVPTYSASDSLHCKETRFMLLPSGKIALCNNDKSLKRICGNLTKQSYDSLKESSAYVLREVICTRCSQYEHRRKNDSGCINRAEQTT